MDKDTYIKMLNDRVYDSRMNMEESKKKYLELNSAYETIIKQRDDFMTWMKGAKDVENKD